MACLLTVLAVLACIAKGVLGQCRKLEREQFYYPQYILKLVLPIAQCIVTYTVISTNTFGLYLAEK